MYTPHTLVKIVPLLLYVIPYNYCSIASLQATYGDGECFGNEYPIQARSGPIIVLTRPLCQKLHQKELSVFIPLSPIRTYIDNIKHLRPDVARFTSHVQGLEMFHNLVPDQS